MQRANKSIFILLVSTIFLSIINNSFAVEKKYHNIIKKFILDIKNRDANSISQYIAFPFKRKNPIPSIKSKDNLKKRFDQLFDPVLSKIIVNSNIENDWDAVGSRGIMLQRGIVWIDYDGRLIAINYQSKKEKKLASQLIKAQIKSLHKSVRKFKQPILNWKTSKFKIRIDDLGEDNYRYASWSIQKQYTDKPDLILNNGKLVFEGSGGNHYYLFKNGQYSYRLSANIIGKSLTPIGELDVFKSNKKILHDEAVDVIFPGH